MDTPGRPSLRGNVEDGIRAGLAPPKPDGPPARRPCWRPWGVTLPLAPQRRGWDEAEEPAVRDT